MTLQQLIFRQNRTASPELYSRGAGASGLPVRPAAGKLSLDTYFNSFSYPKYRDHTRVDRVTVRAVIKGSARLTVRVFDGRESVVGSAAVNSAGFSAAEITVPFSELPENGFLYPEIEAPGSCEIESIEYLADVQPDDISCCAVICTYKREEYVLKNIEKLKSFKFSFLNRIFVIDNGNTLDAKGLSDGFITVLPNRNYGGSGGFARGLIEACEAGFSHVILMDDDIEFYPEVFERMTVFMSLLNGKSKKAWLSAAMLRKSDPAVQYEMGAMWDGSVITHRKHNVNVTSREVLFDNLDNDGLDYAAWWCLCMPTDIVGEQGLPLPLFIKFDDAEYGLRRKKDIPIITMNGIAVTHEDFESKFSFPLIYYDCRNQLITNSVTYEKGNLKFALKRLVKACGKQLLLYRYDAIPLILKAYDDFLKGPDFLKNGDGEQLNAEIIRLSPKQSELSGYGIKRKPASERKKAGARHMLGHFIPPFLLKKEPLCVPISGGDTAECFRHKTLVQYQMTTDIGVVRKRSFPKFVKCCFAVLAAAAGLIFGFGRADKEYRSRKGELTSPEFWRSRLGIKK